MLPSFRASSSRELRDYNCLYSNKSYTCWDRVETCWLAFTACVLASTLLRKTCPQSISISIPLFRPVNFINCSEVSYFLAKWAAIWSTTGPSRLSCAWLSLCSSFSHTQTVQCTTPWLISQSVPPSETISVSKLSGGLSTATTANFYSNTTFLSRTMSCLLMAMITVSVM
jgi:hypothetical protein